ncbi:MAG: hypothetical protein IAI50_07095 [Candidatus Eremiobacteraeota bacterium]|nr:hypothetical protein [Candidatus Eremiobacteraeota bacterium]
MKAERSVGWDGHAGTAGGETFGRALRTLAFERSLGAPELAAAAACDASEIEALFDGSSRITISQLARVASALKLRAIEFLQRSQLLSLEVYALGLDPLYFLPPGTVRHDARIYMREINPRHAVPERDMLVRNPVFKALMADAVLDDIGRLEIELAYLLRAAVQQTGGTL